MKLGYFKGVFNKGCIHAYNFIEDHAMLFLLGFILMAMAGMVHAEDDAGVKDYGAKILPAVKKTFGAGSTFETVGYIAEVGVCMVNYVMSQNVKWFIGAFLLPIFTYAFFG